MSARDDADICLVLEGSYPFIAGGVSSWAHALIASAPHLRFHVVALTPDALPREARYPRPDNLVGLDVLDLSAARPGVGPAPWRRGAIAAAGSRLCDLVAHGRLEDLDALCALLGRERLGARALLDGRDAWRIMEAAYEAFAPDGPLVEFYWSWRSLARGLLAVLSAPVPPARVYHAISTGYAGVFAARAKLETGRPTLLTEHGIYTNERRIELALADWLHHSGRDGFSTGRTRPELHDLWRRAFSAMARLTYAASDPIISLYEGAKAFQRADGAPADRLRVIPNGVDRARFDRPREVAARAPTVALIGRVVPIKDVRTFLHACAALSRRGLAFDAVILGPEDEDPAYAAECRALAAREGLEGRVSFRGAVDVAAWLPRIDVIALSSISEAQPLVVLEAGAAGVPAVTTDVGACREMLEGFGAEALADAAHGGLQGGRVVPVSDPAALADALASLLGDAATREAMGAALKARVAQRYDKAEIDRIYHGLYADLAARPGAPARRLREAAPWRG